MNQIEQFVQNDLYGILMKKCDRFGYEFSHEIKMQFFGDLADNTSAFKFDEVDKVMLFKAVDHVKHILNTYGVRDGGDYFCRPDQIELISFNDWGFLDRQADTDNQKDNEKESIDLPSPTHYFLKKLLEIADGNINRPKNGYRFDKDIIKFVVYLRMVAGRFAYETLQKNLPLALPSISTVDRYIHNSNHNIVEGVFRGNELKQYLTERNCPLVVTAQ